MILGITGGTGCGKTTLLDEISKLGAMVLDCDEIYHRLLREDTSLQHVLQEAFPQAFSGGRLDRKRLGSIVFSQPDRLLELNRITHSAVKAEVLRALEWDPALAAIDAIALIEGGLAPLCDITVAVVAPPEDRVRRLMARDKISREYALSRIGAQHDEAWFRQRCDYVLENCGTREEFSEKCREFLTHIGIIQKEDISDEHQ